MVLGMAAKMVVAQGVVALSVVEMAVVSLQILCHLHLPLHLT